MHGLIHWGTLVVDSRHGVQAPAPALAITEAFLNIAGPGLAAPLNASAQHAVLVAIQAALENVTQVTNITLAAVEVRGPPNSLQLLSYAFNASVLHERKYLSPAPDNSSRSFSFSETLGSIRKLLASSLLGVTTELCSIWDFQSGGCCSQPSVFQIVHESVSFSVLQSLSVAAPSPATVTLPVLTAAHLTSPPLAPPPPTLVAALTQPPPNPTPSPTPIPTPVATSPPPLPAGTTSLQTLITGRRLLASREGAQVAATIMAPAANSADVSAALEAAVDSGAFLASLVKSGQPQCFRVPSSFRCCWLRICTSGLASLRP